MCFLPFIRSAGGLAAQSIPYGLDILKSWGKTEILYDILVLGLSLFHSIFSFFLSNPSATNLATSSGVFPTFLFSVFSIPNSVSSATNL